MCGRYASATAIDLIGPHFNAAEVEDELTPPGYNVAPTDTVPVVVERDGVRSVVGMRWGLVPSWSANASGGAKMINARRESLGEKPAFRTALAHRRAIVPADAYYEWHTRPGAAKQPHAIRPADGSPLAFAALWEKWRAADGAVLRTCTIVTTASAGGIAYLHDRMPVVLPRQLWDDWLDAEQRGPGDALALLNAAGVPDLVAYPVGPEVNNVRTDGAELLREVPLLPSHEQLDLLG